MSANLKNKPFIFNQKMGLKKWVGSALVSLGTLLSFNSANAQERELTIDLNNPVTNFEANSNDWYSLDQLTGKGSDYLYKSWQRNFGTRSLALLADHYFTHFFKRQC